MKLGMIGLGRMGGNMRERLHRGGHEVIGYRRNPQAADVGSLSELVDGLAAPRTVWVMIPAGDPTEQTIQKLAGLLQKGDLIIDGGNSNFRDSMRRGAELEKQGLLFMDAGTSGGIWGLKIGYCLMVGGSDEAFRRVEPALKTLAPEDGYAHVGPVGAGHFTKMVHNGIEYAMLQAYAEGFEILEASQFDLDLHGISALWNHGSVVRSWLLELAERAFERDPKLAQLGPSLAPVLTGPAARSVLLPAVLARLHLLEYIRLTPEGDAFGAHRRLTKALLARGQRAFSFSYHSPSLVPGNTPYVRTERDLAEFLDRLRCYFDYFFGVLGGVAMTPMQLHEKLAIGKPGAQPC